MYNSKTYKEMKRKYYLNLLTIIMVAMLSVVFVSCSKDDKDDELEQTENISEQDPEGTIVLNMSSGASGNYYKIGDLCAIHIDEANNFKGERYNNAEFVSVGLVGGLGKIKQIPNSGWAESAAVVPGTGYVMRCNGQYARIYVIEYLGQTYTDEQGNTYGATSGAKIKYQAPFQLPISLESSSLTFTSEASSQSVRLKNATSVSVEEAPVWCTVSTDINSITVRVSENLSAQQYAGDIILKNSVSSVKLSVIQKSSTSPKFEGGRGTADDPYQIKTAQQLDNVRIALNSHFVQTADIDLGAYLDTNGSGWEPIGDLEKPYFTGTFDGNMQEIRSVWIKRPTTGNIGLFGTIYNASISNIRLIIGDKGFSGHTAGGICGSAQKSIINSCSVSGNITGQYGVGGISAGGNSTTIKQCYSQGIINLTSVNWAGGICPSENVDILDCYSEATINVLGNSNAKAMGIGGFSVRNCYYAGKLNGGGFALTYYQWIEHSYYLSGCGYVGYYGQELSSSEMMKQSSFEGWDFVNIWKITEGKTYPTLRCFDK